MNTSPIGDVPVMLKASRRNPNRVAASDASTDRPDDSSRMETAKGATQPMPEATTGSIVNTSK